MQPGIYKDISNDAYHAGPGASKSLLDLVHDNPIALRKAQLDREAGKVRDSTPSQALGSAFHALVLEPKLFAQTYVRELQRADVPDAIDDAAELRAMIDELNATRLPKLPLSGGKDDLRDRIIAARAEMGCALASDNSTGACNAVVSVPDLKAEIAHLNASRPGLLPVSGTRHDMAETLRSAGVGVTLWADVLAAWREANTDRVALPAPVWDQVHSMRDATMSHTAARLLLTAPGCAELSAYWTEPVIDPITGAAVDAADSTEAWQLCRCRPDWWRRDGILIDLKSTQPGGAAPEEFRRSIEKWRYHVQHPFYLRGAARALQAMQHREQFQHECQGMAAPHAFVFIAVENDACVIDGMAKGVAVYMLGAESVALGGAEMRADLHTLHQCQATGIWPGYDAHESILPIDLPAYAFTKAAAKVAA